MIWPDGCTVVFIAHKVNFDMGDTVSRFMGTAQDQLDAQDITNKIKEVNDLNLNVPTETRRLIMGEARSYIRQYAQRYPHHAQIIRGMADMADKAEISLLEREMGESENTEEMRAKLIEYETLVKIVYPRGNTSKSDFIRYVRAYLRDEPGMGTPPPKSRTTHFDATTPPGLSRPAAPMRF